MVRNDYRVGDVLKFACRTAAFRGKIIEIITINSNCYLIQYNSATPDIPGRYC